jgi:hypothetical protein
MAFTIQHRETGCFLIVEGFGPRQRDAWVSAKDWVHATRFETAEEARAAAKNFGLTNQHYKIANHDNTRTNH